VIAVSVEKSLYIYKRNEANFKHFLSSSVADSLRECNSHNKVKYGNITKYDIFTPIIPKDNPIR